MRCVGLAGEDKNDGGVNSELWQACAGPLVNLPLPGTHVVYFPQGHSEQVNSPLISNTTISLYFIFCFRNSLYKCLYDKCLIKLFIQTWPYYNYNYNYIHFVFVSGCSIFEERWGCPSTKLFQSSLQVALYSSQSHLTCMLDFSF